jgi:uncharacterized membrane protein
MGADVGGMIEELVSLGHHQYDSRRDGRSQRLFARARVVGHIWIPFVAASLLAATITPRCWRQHQDAPLCLGWRFSCHVVSSLLTILTLQTVLTIINDRESP